MDNLRKAQLIMLDILYTFHNICEKYGFRYWIDCGTLLGAVRHKGFIPWDDDVDVCMPIEDFKEFLKVAESELPEGMELQTRFSGKGFRRYFAKIRDSRGKIIEKFEERRIKKGKKIKYNMGIYIDIFPCITIDIKDLKKYRLLSKITNRVRKILDIPHLVNLLFDVADTHLHKGWEVKENLYVARSVRFIWMEGRAIPLKSLLPLKKYKFEFIEVYGPNDYDTYLKVLYGENYIIPPPPERRLSHSAKIEIYDFSFRNEYFKSVK